MEKKEKYIMKVSGESFIGETNLDASKALEIAKQIVKISKNNNIAVICGAGNIVRGRNYSDKVYADYMGMTATNINIILLYSAIKELTNNVCMFSLIGDNKIIENYSIDKCLEKYNEGKIVLIGGGNGLIGFTTDSAVLRRANELGIKKIMFGKAIDGVYDRNPDDILAKKYDYITPIELLNDRIQQKFYKNGVMDDSALVDLINSDIDMYVYKSTDESAIDKILDGENPGTIITNNKELLKRRKIY